MIENNVNAWFMACLNRFSRPDLTTNIGDEVREFMLEKLGSSGLDEETYGGLKDYVESCQDWSCIAQAVLGLTD